MNIPTWAECSLMIDNEKYCKEVGKEQETQKPNELARFIYENEPARDEEAAYWRERLQRLVDFILQPNSTVERP